MAKRKSRRTIESKGHKKQKVEKTFNCLICMESKPIKDCFKIKELKGRTNTCCSKSHPFCMDCISKHIEAKVKQNESRIECPNVDCRKNIDFDSCLGIIPKLVMDSWEDVLSKSTISSITSLYCPFKDCSAPLLKSQQSCKAAKAKCPHCSNEFCVNCMVTWHRGYKCKKYKENEEMVNDGLLINLAKAKRWKRCPRCKIYIDKIDGCLHVQCRCGKNFDYV